MLLMQIVKFPVHPLGKGLSISHSHSTELFATSKFGVSTVAMKNLCSFQAQESVEKEQKVNAQLRLGFKGAHPSFRSILMLWFLLWV